MGTITSKNSRLLTRGYSLIEVTVVLAIVTFIGALTFFGLGSEGEDQRLRAAQKEIVGSLRSLQTQVDNGVGNVSYKAASFVTGNTYYCLNTNSLTCVGGTRVDLPARVTLEITPSPLIVYFAHPEYSAFPAGTCGATTAFYACQGGGAVTSGSVTIGFSGISTRSVKIEGAGTKIGRIYANE